MLYRKLKPKIEKWIEEGQKPLLVTGARQTGKSFLIRETLKEKQIDFIELNFIENAEAKTAFAKAMLQETNDFLLVLRLFSPKPLKKGMVVFLDEIQEIKETLTMMKFLSGHSEYKYILSGSLLGVELTSLRSAPVGYLETLEMYPMDLEEFYIANGLSEDMFSYLKEKFLRKEKVDEVIHEKLINTFYRYLIVGGMPKAVQCYINEMDLNKVMRIHRSIIREYKRDFTKYEERSKLKLSKTYELLPSELNSKNKRYQFSDLGENKKFNRYENSFNWLIDAGVAIPTYNVTEFQIPLEASKKSNLFKFFCSDVGLLTSSYGSSTIIKLLQRGESINCGAIFENFVAQELHTHRFKTYYFNNKKHGEVDFLLEYQESLLPIEVKSGKDYKIHSALTYFMSTAFFKNALVFSTHNMSTDGNVTYPPIYMTMFLNKEENIDKLSIDDLSRLKPPQSK